MAEYLKDSSGLTALMVAAHKHTSQNREEVLRSAKLGCYSCLASFESEEVSEWIDREQDPSKWTAHCPQCESDTMIGDASGFVIEMDFLDEMRRYWLDPQNDEGA